MYIYNVYIYNVYIYIYTVIIIFLHHLTFIVCSRHFCHRLPLLRPDGHHRANGATYHLQATEFSTRGSTDVVGTSATGWVKSPPKGSPKWIKVAGICWDVHVTKIQIIMDGFEHVLTIHHPLIIHHHMTGGITIHHPPSTMDAWNDAFGVSFLGVY